MEKYIATILLFVPLAGFLFSLFVGKKINKFVIGTISTGTILVSFVLSLYLFGYISSSNESIKVNLFEWFSFESFKINFSFLIDKLSIIWLLFVTGIATLIHMYSISYMQEDKRFSMFFAYMNLFVFFMLLLVMGSNLLLLFIGWEGVGLSSYLLIGFWYENNENNNAAKKAFIMNRIGDLGLLIGIFTLAYLFNSLDYTTLQTAIASSTSNLSIPLITLAALGLLVGALGKSAQIPLYTWLPDAMAGPTPVSALIHAATMVTAGIYLITRMHFLFEISPNIQFLITIIGTITAVLAATIGLMQNDIKKILAYSTVSQLGLMFIALGFGAYEAAVFHVITHAFFKACLFLGAGSVIHAMAGEQDIRKMGGLKAKMPITFWTMMLSGLAISGIFPLAGFWSKDEILMVAFQKNKSVWVLASIASIMTAFYMFRLLFLTFFNTFRGTEVQKNHLHESPKNMTIPLVILAILATIGGVINLPGSNWLSTFLSPILTEKGSELHHFGMQEYLLMGIAMVGAVVGIYSAYFKFNKKHEIPLLDTEMKGISKIIYHKFYIDEIYDAFIVKPLEMLSHFLRRYIETNLSEFIFSSGNFMSFIGNKGKCIQNGSIGLYLLFFVLGIASILLYLFLA